MSFISIIDYGSGNLRSVYNALNYILEKKKKKNTKITITASKNEINRSSHLILPGVGAFESCINGLKKTSLIETIDKAVQINKVPFLGICVGMQMLAEKGFENGEHDGLGWIKGGVKKINPKNSNLKIPHMGWNDLKIEKNNRFIKSLKKKIGHLKKSGQPSAYFVHSYNFLLDDKENKIMSCEYGQNLTAMVAKKNILGTQFHPEKSHDFGLAFLETFLDWEGQ